MKKKKSCHILLSRYNCSLSLSLPPFFFWLAILLFLFSVKIHVYFCAVIIWYIINSKTVKATVSPPCLYYCTHELSCFSVVLGISSLSELIFMCSVVAPFQFLVSKEVHMNSFFKKRFLFVVMYVSMFCVCACVCMCVCVHVCVQMRPGKPEEGTGPSGGGVTSSCKLCNSDEKLRSLLSHHSSLQVTFTW